MKSFTDIFQGSCLLFRNKELKELYLIDLFRNSIFGNLLRKLKIISLISNKTFFRKVKKSKITIKGTHTGRVGKSKENDILRFCN